MPTVAQTWEPVRDSDLVFYTNEEKRFVLYSGRNGTFIALVRKREGIWMKCTDPLTHFSALTIRDLIEWKRYKLGADLLATTPQARPYLRRVA